MLNGIKFLIIAIIFVTVNNFARISSLDQINSTEYKLFEFLTQNYSKDIRPVKKWSDTLDVFVNIELKKIANVLEYQQTILIYVRLELNWTDVNLAWDPNKYDQIQSIVFPADKIWIPDLHLFNSAVENDKISPLNVQVFSNGVVQAFPINQLYAHCDFDFSDFPYDAQTCDFMIGNVLDKTKIKIWLTSKANETKLVPNSEWKFVSIKDRPEFELTVPGTLDKNDWFSADWSVSMFSLKIKRHSKFYQNLFIWPLIFILIIASCVFILPPTCIERASMGVLLLLTLVIMSLMLDSYTPKNSINLSIIDNLIGFAMFMVTWSTFVSTLILGLDKDSFTYRQVPDWLKNVLLNYIGKVTLRYGTLKRIFNSNQLNREEEMEVLDSNQLLQNIQNSTTQEVASQSTNENLDLSQAKTLLVLINNQLSMFRTRLQEKDNREQNKKDWFVISCVLDRFCLIIYYSVMFLGFFFIYI